MAEIAVFQRILLPDIALGHSSHVGLPNIASRRLDDISGHPPGSLRYCAHDIYKDFVEFSVYQFDVFPLQTEAV